MSETEKPQESPNRVRFVHKKPENYQSYYVNGVFGAVTARGDFEMNLFFEHTDIPEEEMMKFEGGKLKPIEQNPREVTVTRDFKVCIITTPQNAEAIGEWLIKMVGDYKKKQETKE